MIIFYSICVVQLFFARCLGFPLRDCHCFLPTCVVTCLEYPIGVTSLLSRAREGVRVDV